MSDYDSAKLFLSKNRPTLFTFTCSSIMTTSAHKDLGFTHPDHPMHKGMIQGIAPEDASLTSEHKNGKKLNISTGAVVAIFGGILILGGGLAYMQYKMFKSSPKAYVGLQLGGQALSML